MCHSESQTNAAKKCWQSAAFNLMVSQKGPNDDPLSCVTRKYAILLFYVLASWGATFLDLVSFLQHAKTNARTKFHNKWTQQLWLSQAAFCPWSNANWNHTFAMSKIDSIIKFQRPSPACFWEFLLEVNLPSMFKCQPWLQFNRHWGASLINISDIKLIRWKFCDQAMCFL